MNSTKAAFLLSAAALLFISPIPDADAGKRSYAAKADFKRQNPCPETGQPRGRCPGWEIDHVVPLKCGGDDLPSNMQWLTIIDHKEKTRREAPLCLKPTKGARE